MSVRLFPKLLNERWTLDDLAEHNVLVREQTTLKKIILDMENLVLANAGVDAFEEVFKLVYAKLYDEAQAAQGGKQKRYLQFRVGGSTPASSSIRSTIFLTKRRLDGLASSWMASALT